jgi:alpha-L-fucosidase
MSTPYQPTWESLRRRQTPEWFRTAKFGIYTHWGVYSVPACGPNATWYPYFMYHPGTPQYEHHVKTYGLPSQFGYKDFIPMFTGDKFDPDEWAELFKQAGARFAGPVGEHHDGFCLWDSKLTEWKATRMGPRRDVVGELAAAIRRQGMRYMVALHHAENWWFYPHWIKEYDTADPRYAGLYGEPHNLTWSADTAPFLQFEQWLEQDRPSKAFLDSWLGKVREVIDGYQPDLLWFDTALRYMPEHYIRAFLAYYYNKAEDWGKDVVVTYKWHDFVPGAGVVDLELGRFNELTYNDWITDTTVDDGHGWGYLRDTPYKSAASLIHYLIDNVSKNGYMLLNVGPKPDGTIPTQAQDILREMGRWLAVNGEAIYDTTPWLVYGEGPTQMSKAGPFTEDQDLRYSGQDVRFTARGDTLYAICLGWPGEAAVIKTIAQKLYPSEIASVTMLGADGALPWRMSNDSMVITPPPRQPCQHAVVFKITRRPPFEQAR